MWLCACVTKIRNIQYTKDNVDRCQRSRSFLSEFHPRASLSLASPARAHHNLLCVSAARAWLVSFRGPVLVEGDYGKNAAEHVCMCTLVRVSEHVWVCARGPVFSVAVFLSKRPL